MLDITVLICTHNSAARLPVTLRHLQSQVGADDIAWEVLIVDYKSTDDTEDVLNSVWKSKKTSLTLIPELMPGKTPALETGIKAAKGRAVCIIDDDNWVDENYIRIANDIMRNHPDVGVIGAFGEAVCEVPPPAWFEQNQGTYAVGPQGKKRGYVDDLRRLWFWGAGSVVRKEAWEKAKSRGFVPIFNPTRGAGGVSFMKGFSGGEDPEMCFAIQLAGYRLWYEPGLIYKHYIPKGRLNEQFLQNATSGTAAAQPILRIYLAELTPDSFIGAFRRTIYKRWLFHLLYVLISYGRSGLKLILGSASHKSTQLKKIASNFNSQIVMIAGMRRQYGELVRSIEKLKTN